MASLARPDGLGHGFVDDGYPCGFFSRSKSVKSRAADERDPHGLEVAGCHVVKADQGAAIIGVGLFAFAKDGAREGRPPNTPFEDTEALHDSGNSFGAFDGGRGKNCWP